jgi:hypothetical protein
MRVGWLLLLVEVEFRALYRLLCSWVQFISSRGYGSIRHICPRENKWFPGTGIRGVHYRSIAWPCKHRNVSMPLRLEAVVEHLIVLLLIYSLLFYIPLVPAVILSSRHTQWIYSIISTSQIRISVLLLHLFPCGASTRFRVMASPYGASRSHSLDKPDSVGLLWKNDQPEAETSTWQHTTLKLKNIHATGGIRTRNPSKRAAANPRLRPRGRWDRLLLLYLPKKISSCFGES